MDLLMERTKSSAMASNTREEQQAEDAWSQFQKKRWRVAAEEVVKTACR